MDDRQRAHAGQTDRGAAEAALREAWQRLNTLRVFALTGGPYDPDEFDQAVLEFRQRWEEARVAREDARRAEDGHRAA